jgi:DNA-binding transcriptional LysR family regulator
MDIAKVDLNLLRALEALLMERHVTRAAARLHLSQPAMSATLARLRATFGDPLFVRGPRGLTPTARAAALEGPLRAVLHDIAGLLSAGPPFDPQQATRSFAIATTDYMHSLLVPHVVRLLAHEAPRVRLSLRLPNSPIAGQIESGDADLGILNLQRATPELHARELLRERFAVIAAADNARVGRRLTLDRFCALDHVLASPAGGAFAAQTDEVLAALGRTRQVRLSLQSFDLVAKVVAASEMIAVFPLRLARSHRDALRILAPPLELPGFTMVAVWHERLHRDPAHRWLREWLARRFAGGRGLISS